MHTTKFYIGGLGMNGEALVNAFEKQTLCEANPDLSGHEDGFWR